MENIFLLLTVFAIGIIIGNKIVRFVKDKYNIKRFNYKEKHNIEDLISELRGLFMDKHNICYSNHIISEKNGWNLSGDLNSFIKDDKFFTIDEIVRNNLIRVRNYPSDKYVLTLDKKIINLV